MGGVCVRRAARAGDVPGSAGACASTCPASSCSVRTKRSTISNLCLLLHYVNTWREEPIPGFGADKLPTPQPQGIPRSRLAPFLLTFLFPENSFWCPGKGIFHVYHNLCNGSELTIHLLMLRLETKNEKALLSQAPTKAKVGVKRADETASKRGITIGAGAHSHQDRNLSLEGQTKKSTTH